jgi:integrase
MAIRVTLLKKTIRKGVKSKEWWMVWYETGPNGKRKQRKKSTGCTRRNAAEKIRDNLTQKLENEVAGILNSKERMRTARFVDCKKEFLQSVKTGNRRATYSQYKTSLKLFEEICKPDLLVNVRPHTIEQFKRTRLESIGKITVDRDLRTIRRFLNWAVQMEYLESAIKIRLYNDQKVEPPVKVPRADIRSIVEALEAGMIKLKYCSADWWVMLIRLFLDTGCRRSEILQLKWSAVHVDYLVIKRETSKTNRTLPVFISPDLQVRLADWKVTCMPASDDELVLPRRHQIRTIWDEWVNIRSACGLSINFKDLRSTCASEMAATQPLSVVQHHLRHSTPVLTAKFYVNSADAAKKAAAQREPL